MKKFYKLIIENKEKQIRYSSTYLYTDKDLSNYDTDLLIRREYLLNNPDASMLHQDYIEDELSNITVVGKYEIKYEII